MSKIKKSFIALIFAVMALSLTAGIVTVNKNFTAQAADEGIVAIEMIGGASVRCATENEVTTAGIRFSAKVANEYLTDDYTVGMSISNGSETRFFAAKKYSKIDDNYSRFNVVLNNVDSDTVFKAIAKIKNAEGVVGEAPHYSERSFRQVVDTASMAGDFDNYDEEEKLDYEKLKTMVSENLTEKVNGELYGASVKSRFPEKITYVYTQNAADLANGANIGIKASASYDKDGTAYYLPIYINAEMRAGKTYGFTFDFKILNNGGNSNFYYLLNVADSTAYTGNGFSSVRAINGSYYNVGNNVYSCTHSVTADKDYGAGNPFALYVVLSNYNFKNFEFTLCNLKMNDSYDPQLKVLHAYSDKADVAITESTIAAENVGYYAKGEKVVKIQNNEKVNQAIKIVTPYDLEKGKTYAFYFVMRQACESSASFQHFTSNITAALKSGATSVTGAAKLADLSGTTDYSALSAKSEVKLLNRIDFTAAINATDVVLELNFGAIFPKLDVEISQIVCVEIDSAEAVAKFTQKAISYYKYTNAWLSDDDKYLTGDAKYAIVVNKYRDANEDSSIKEDSRVDYSTGISLKAGSYTISYDIVVDKDYPLGTYNGSTFTNADNKLFAGVAGVYGYLGTDGTLDTTLGTNSLQELCSSGKATKTTVGNKTVYHVTIEATTTSDIDDLTFTFYFYNNRRGTMGLCNFAVTPSENA